MSMKEALSDPDLISSFDVDKLRLFKIWLNLLGNTQRRMNIGVKNGRLVIKDTQGTNALAILLGPGRDDYRCGHIWITYIYGNEELRIQDATTEWKEKKPRLTIHEKLQIGDTYIMIPSLVRVYFERGDAEALNHLNRAMAVT